MNDSARTAVTGSSWLDSAATVTRITAVVTPKRGLGWRPGAAGDAVARGRTTGAGRASPPFTPRKPSLKVDNQ
ncbi:hypothetical protein MCAG_04975 [Micromonospora sp. ATCC 39149]|nr:hypothetical protein MCAG_04975 [Micromonospora sp. ATCC 39149]